MKRIISFIVLVALTFCSVSVISVSAAGSAPSISVEETVLPSGSSITVDYDNISNVADDVRVSIYYVGDTLDGWWDPTSVCTLKDSTGTVLRGESGTIAFPTDDKKGATGYQPGVYQVVLFDGSRNLLDRILVTIGDAPKISVDKELWLEDCKGIREFYKQVGDRVPAELYGELEALEARLAK